MTTLIPRTFWSWPVPSLFEEEEWPSAPVFQNGLTVSEDDKNVYVEASVPGLDSKDVEVTFEKGVLWIRGQKSQEEKAKKYYRKALSSFSYRVAVPETVDEKAEPQAQYKNGICTVTFKKTGKAQPKKIKVTG